MEDEQPSEQEQQLELKIKKEMEKLKYYLEQTDELIEGGDYKEMETVSKRSGTILILDGIYELVSKIKEVKVERGEDTARTIRQWKKTIKESYSPWVAELNKLQGILTRHNEEVAGNEASKRREEAHKEEEQYQQEIRRHEQQLWEERCRLELETAEKKLEMERAARGTQAKLPKLKITVFRGTASDWVRFENMFLTQIDRKPISDEEKLGYLLEMVSGKVRDKISNLKPGSIGYKTAWERQKKEYGQTRLVVNSHIDEIVNLETVKGSSYNKVQAFYEKLSKNYDALQTLGEHTKLDGFVMCTLNKL